MNLGHENEKYQITDIVNSKGHVSRELLLDGFITSDAFRSDGTRLYTYRSTDCYWEYLSESEINHRLRDFIPESLQSKVSNSMLKTVALDMLEAPSLMVDFAKHCDQTKLNVLNGVVDVLPLKISKSAKEDYYNYKLRFNYIEGAKLEDAKHFLSFLRTSLDYDTAPAKAKLLLQIMGYCISDVTGAKRLFYFVGAPGGGKSLILNLIEYVVGRKYRSVVGLHELADRFRLYNLVNARVNLCHEMRNVRLKCLDVVKKIAANEPILVEQKGKDAIEVQATTKMIFCGNSMPKLSEYDNEGILTRIVLLLFPHGNTEGKWDINLLSKLKSEVDIIFSVAVRELKGLIESQFVFAKPADSISFLTSYGNNQNSVKLFVEECCEVAANMKEHYKPFYEAYLKFCHQNTFSGVDETGFKSYILGIQGVDGERFRIDGSPTLWGVKGIGIKEYM